MDGLQQQWATSGITPVWRTPGEAGVRARVYADVRRHPNPPTWPRLPLEQGSRRCGARSVRGRPRHRCGNRPCRTPLRAQ
ncbi:DUF6207 family protein [Streptomyces flavidovirens]|uniref:DUF6207 family protein n=1 Tax=Streptomyces flavidovirens TaxID=67298 RepID=A0ABW6RPE6_9ACTN